MPKKTILLLIAGICLASFAAIALYQWHDTTQRAAWAKLPAKERGLLLLDNAGCTSCHQPGSAFRAPILSGLYGKPVRLASGETVIADQAYLERSILEPKAQIVEGYQGIMPSYSGRLSPDEVQAVIEAMK